MWKNTEEIIERILRQEWAAKPTDDATFWRNLIEWIRDQILPEFLTELSNQVDEIIDINPDLSEREILARVTRYMVEFLGARSASVRIYDPETGQMLSYGSFPFQEEDRETYIPLEESVAGKVVKSRQTYLVPNILKEKLYHDKGVVERKGTYSVMAIHLTITSFAPHERDRVGVIQVYCQEKDRKFSPIEVQVAELMARRLSFVIARKKILDMHRANEKKEAIVRNIFLKLGAREGVKMKEIFNRVIPELADIINVQSCALFSVSDDMEYVI
ncbi:MAG: GAF domain-containing protein, partial [Deltaproteobacteria bacterium]|nr:GAF domain-containing protein [Deltaproteobacteria bacterium]